MARQGRIAPEDLSPGTAPAGESAPFPSLEEMEREHITQAIQHCAGNMKAAADILKIGRSTLYRKVSDYGILS